MDTEAQRRLTCSGSLAASVALCLCGSIHCWQGPCQRPCRLLEAVGGGWRVAGDEVVELGRTLEYLRGQAAGAGLPVSHFTLALHLGEVLYGNIGAPDRLDLTVVGPTVNETAHIQAMCRAIDRGTVTSAAFAAAATGAAGSAGATAAGGAERLVSLGRYALRGVRQPQELFTLAAPAA